MFANFIRFFLQIIARGIIVIHRPIVIGVTGTVGKSTITTHVGKFLSGELGKKNVLFSQRHYNGEYGLPLTIINASTGGKNPFLWIFIFLKGITRMLLPFPRYVVLEYGIDHPGEMDFLLSIAIPDIAIVTEIAPNHLEQFKTFELYRAEKLKITRDAKKVIVHNSQRQFIDREVLCYGLGAISDIDISHIRIDTNGTHAQINIAQKSYPIDFSAFGIFHIENILPLYPIAEHFAINPEKVAHYLKNFEVEPGRSAVIPGIGGSTIIDGSYNGGYLSIREGIESLVGLIPHSRVYFFLGDMRELGPEEETMHKKLAEEINAMVPIMDYCQFFFVGPLMKKYFIPAIHHSYQYVHGLSSIDIGKKIKEEILSSKSDSPVLIFVKGSQNTIFLEEGIKEFLDPTYDSSKLCRQSREWQKKKQLYFKSIL